MCARVHGAHRCNPPSLQYSNTPLPRLPVTPIAAQEFSSCAETSQGVTLVMARSTHVVLKTDRFARGGR